MPDDKLTARLPDDRSLFLWLRITLLFVLVALAVLTIIERARAQTYEYTVLPIPALTNTAQTVKASPGAMLYLSCFNGNAAATYVQVFNSIGVVTVGTTAPTLAFYLAPTSASGQIAPSNSLLQTSQRPGTPYYLSTGIQVAATTTPTGGSAPVSTVWCDVAHR